MKNKLGDFILNIVTNQGFTYCVYLLIIVSILYVLGFNLPKYEANNNENYKEENTVTENGSYRKYNYDTDELQFIITNGKDKHKVADVSGIYEKIGQSGKLYVEISSDDIP